jgi:hypothetical protein
MICNNKHFRSIYKNTLLKCKNCGFVTTNLNLTKDDLNRIYSENYFKGEEYLSYFDDKKTIQSNFKKRLESIIKTINKSSIKNCLEIGCAYGFFGEILKKKLTLSILE